VAGKAVAGRAVGLPAVEGWGGPAVWWAGLTAATAAAAAAAAGTGCQPGCCHL